MPWTSVHVKWSDADLAILEALKEYTGLTLSATVKQAVRESAHARGLLPKSNTANKKSREGVDSVATG